VQNAALGPSSFLWILHDLSFCITWHCRDGHSDRETRSLPLTSLDRFVIHKETRPIDLPRGSVKVLRGCEEISLGDPAASRRFAW
jgi:hypothetical protein